MTHRLATNYSKNYCNRTLIVKLIVENVVTGFFGGDTVYVSAHIALFLAFSSANRLLFLTICTLTAKETETQHTDTIHSRLAMNSVYEDVGLGSGLL